MQMYFIAIVLPEDLNQKIMKYKNMMLEKYNCKVGLKSPAHITVTAPFWLDEEKEKQLLSDLNIIGQTSQTFTIVTSNFSAFKPRTIFVEVKQNDQLEALKRSADDFFRNNSFYNIKIDTRPFHPHITIATRDLSKKDFFEIWPWFEEKKFLEEWIAEGISVLRHNKKDWDVIYTCQFNKVKD